MKLFKKGFTLVELLVVIGILAILTAVVLVAVNPGRQLQQSRDAKRRADVNTILGAISAFMADPENNGQLPTSVQSAVACDPSALGTGDAIGSAVGNIDVENDVSPRYVAAIPTDPSGGTADDTGYKICIFDATDRRVSIIADGELAGTIVVTR